MSPSLLWEKVKENRKALKACPRHRFADPYVFGKRVTCANCGGELSAVEAGAYCDGYAAAGRNPAEIWPAVYSG